VRFVRRRRGRPLALVAVRSKTMTTYKRFITDTTGQDLIEYGLLIGIIAVGLATILPAIGNKVLDYFTDLNTALPAAD
jgi:Flp pilus assembly pilin Flp